MIRLVINADDLGLHPRIDAGILRAREGGVLTSATVLVTGPNAQQAVRGAQERGLALGVHLCLCTRLPPALPAGEVPTVAPGGVFRRSWAQLALAVARRQVRLAEVREELRAQVRRAEVLGFSPDHLDAHQHLHLLPRVAGVVLEVAEEFGLPVRWPKDAPRPDWLRSPGGALKAGLLGGLGLLQRSPRTGALRAHGVFESGALDEAALLRLVDRLPEGDHELLCHPGEDPGVVPEDPEWTYGWTRELAALMSPRVRERLAARGIQLTTYRQLFPSGRRASNSTWGVV